MFVIVFGEKEGVNVFHDRVFLVGSFASHADSRPNGCSQN